LTSSAPHVAVLGAGAFGGWTALALARRGARVTLVDAWGAGNARSSSGGGTRVIRHTYGPHRRYLEWVRAALPRWRAEEAALGARLFEETGVLWLVSEGGDYEECALAQMQELGVPHERLAPAEVARRWPALCTDGVQWALFEPTAGYLRARRATRAVERALRAAGGEVRRARVLAPARGPALVVPLADGGSLAVDVAVYAPGPWLAALFPELAQHVRVTRQELFYFGTPPGDPRFGPPQLPVWGDRGARFWYGIPEPDGRGFKLGDDTRGPLFEPTRGDRTPSAEGLAAARAYLARRFPALAGAPLLAARVCQYTDTPDGDFIVDRLPGRDDVWIVGGGSGHGFKHGPVLGDHVAACVLGAAEREPAFALARFQGTPG
jgi:glycine/D-amino acid oxidase-like deaminating enzyme